MNSLQISKAVEYPDLNPHNFALKNTYVSNLLTTALATLPTIERITGGVVGIVRGFDSKKSISCKDVRPDTIDYKFGEGLALEITVQPYDHNLVVLACKKIIDDNNASFKFVIDRAKARVVIYRIKKTSSIEEELEDNQRIVFVKE